MPTLNPETGPRGPPKYIEQQFCCLVVIETHPLGVTTHELQNLQAHEECTAIKFLVQMNN